MGRPGAGAVLEAPLTLPAVQAHAEPPAEAVVEIERGHALKALAAALAASAALRRGDIAEGLRLLAAARPPFEDVADVSGRAVEGEVPVAVAERVPLEQRTWACFAQKTLWILNPSLAMLPGLMPHSANDW